MWIYNILDWQMSNGNVESAVKIANHSIQPSIHGLVSILITYSLSQ